MTTFWMVCIVILGTIILGYLAFARDTRAKANPHLRQLPNGSVLPLQGKVRERTYRPSPRQLRRKAHKRQRLARGMQYQLARR